MKLCTCTQSMALVTRSTFQLEILIRSTIYAMHKFWEQFWRARETLVKQPPDEKWKVCCDSLQWHHNELNCVSNQQPHDCLFNRLFRRRSMKISKLCATGLCARISQIARTKASNAEYVPIWWRHHYLQDAGTTSMVISTPGGVAPVLRLSIIGLSVSLTSIPDLPFQNMEYP